MLGVDGGNLAKHVEQELRDKAVGERLTEQGALDGAPPSLVDEFRNRLLANPMTNVSVHEVTAGWRAHMTEIGKELSEAKCRALPHYCKSEAGITHIVADHRLTKCGWLWSRSDCTVLENIAVTCRKCAGRSVRWGK